MILALESKLNGLIRKLSEINTLVLIICGFIVQVIIMAAFRYFWWDVSVSQPVVDSSLQSLLLAVIIGPLLETALFQYGIIVSLTNTVKSKALAIIISAIAFGLTHLYSEQYIVATFFSGLLFALLFLVFQEKNRRGFLYVLIIHSAFNLFVFGMAYWY